jgi:hypothetical protein
MSIGATFGSIFATSRSTALAFASLLSPLVGTGLVLMVALLVLIRRVDFVIVIPVWWFGEGPSWMEIFSTGGATCGIFPKRELAEGAFP